MELFSSSREEIKQAEWSFPIGPTIKMHGIIFNGFTVPCFSEHF